MRILMITQWFDPEPAFKGLDLARELRARGHEVQVLTGFPNYPGGTLYPGYRMRLFQRELIDGIRVVRVALFPSHDRSALRRSLNYVSFALTAGLLGPLLIRRPDAVHVYHPPASVALAALTVKVTRRAPFVFDVMDLWPDTLRATGMIKSRWALSIIDRWCRLVYGASAQITVASEGFKRMLVSRGVPEAKIRVVYNWAPEEASAEPEQMSIEDDRLASRFNVVFAGNMGRAQDLKTVLDAAAIVESELPDVQFVLAGGGIDTADLERYAESVGVGNVVFAPRMSFAGVAALFQRAQVLLVHLRADPLFKITVPSKTQAYLAAGRPILAAVEGETADIVTRAGAGIGCRPQDPRALADAVRSLRLMPPGTLDEMGRRGRAFYDLHMSKAAGIDLIEDALQSAARSRG